MGGQALREDGGESRQTHRAVEKAEDILASLRPRKPSGELNASLGNAEASVRELMRLATSIDSLFGRSAKGEVADLQKEVGRLRAQLGVIGEEQVAGVNRRYGAHARRIEGRLETVESALRNQSVEEAREAFNSAREEMARLSGTISATRRIFAAGAPPELVSAPDRALELAQSGDNTRAQLLRKAANTFIDNREFFATGAGRPGTASLAEFVRAVSEPAQQLDLAKAALAITTFAGDLAYPPEQRAADRDAIAKSGRALGAATAGKIAATLDDLNARGETERARILAAMAFRYIDMTGPGAAGLDTMKALLVRYADTGAEDAVEQFADIAARAAFAADIGRVRGAVGAWETGAHKTVVQKTLEKVDGLLGQRRYAEAGRLLTYAAMYADSITALGLNRPGPAAAAGVSNMAQALDALGRGEKTVGGRDGAEAFVENYNSAIRSSQAMQLQRSYADMRQKFEGRSPWAGGMPADTLPRLREYEKSAALEGRSLDQLFAACGRAVQSNDAGAYVASVKAFGDRLGNVYARYSASRMADCIDQLDKAIHGIFTAYSGRIPGDNAARLRALREGMKEFSAGLRSGARLGETYPALQFNAFLEAFKREQLQAVIANQMGNNENYAQMAGGITGGMAAVALRESNAELLKAKKALLGGDTAGAREAYDAAMRQRQSALATFSAYGREKQPGRDALAAYNAWHEAHMKVFDGVLAGTETPRLQEQAGLVELSVFSVPENARGILDLSKGQKKVRELALSGNIEGAAKEWERMQGALEKQKFWTNAAAMTAGVAIGFVPGGQVISGAIFMAIATGQAMEEMAATGRVSGMTLLVMGTTVATWGVGGVISGLRTAAAGARAAGQAGRAAAYGLGSTALTTATLGTGALMSGMMVPATVDAWKAGRFGEAAFNVGMALFPFAHMGGTYVAGRINAARGRTVVTFDEAVAAMRAAKAAPAGAEAPAAVKTPTARRMPVAVSEEEIANQSAYDLYRDKGLLQPGINPRTHAYIAERLLGATHPEAMEIINGKAKPRPRQGPERGRAAERTEITAPAHEQVDAAIWERGGSREWLFGGEMIEGEIASTGRLLRSIERVAKALAEKGEELDVIAISGDKSKLNQINQLLGWEYGDRALAAYFELFKRSIGHACGSGGKMFLIRPSRGGDEAIGVILVKKGTGNGVHARLRQALADETRNVFNEFTAPGHKQSLAAAAAMLREPLDLVAEVIDVSLPVSVRKGPDGRIRAVNSDGSDAMVAHEVEAAPGRKETVTEFMPKLVRTTEEQGSASHAPAMRRMLKGGTDTELRRAPNINDVETDPQVRVDGMAFEIRLGITDRTALAEARNLLPKTRKAFHETVNNAFNIRGLNTLFGHYYMNNLGGIVEGAVGEYAGLAHVRIRRLGTMKYMMDGGTPEQVTALSRHIDAHLEAAGVRFRVNQKDLLGTRAKYLSNATPDEALAAISNGHNRLDWGAPAYGDANAAISAMAIGNDATLARLFGGGYQRMRPLIELIRGNPAIRNVEDLLVALDHPEVAGANSGQMRTVFVAFVEREGAAFRSMLDGILVAPAEAEAALLRPAVGAEAEVLQRAPARPGPAAKAVQPARSAATLENTIGRKPRGKELEAGMALLHSDEERAIARVLDAAIAGEIQGPLPPEYQAVLNGIFAKGESRRAGGIAAEERVLLIASSVPDVLFHRGSAALERALAAVKADAGVADDARMFLMVRKGIGLGPEDYGRMSLAHHEAVEQRMRGGMSEAEAIVSVAKEANEQYRRASAELEAGLAGMPAEAAQSARRLLRFMHDRPMTKTEFNAIPDTHISAVNERTARGVSLPRAVLEVMAPYPRLAPKTAAALVDMFGKGRVGEGYLEYFRRNGLSEEFAALAARKAGGGNLEAPAVRSLFFELFGLPPADLQAYFRLAVKGGRAPMLDVESMGKSPEAKGFKAGSGKAPTVDLLSADGARMFSYAQSYLKFASRAAAEIEAVHAASQKPVVLIVPLGGGYVPARTLQLYLNAERRSGIISEFAVIGSPSDATRGADYGGLAQRLKAKYGDRGATCVVIEEISSGNSVKKAEKIAERIRGEAGEEFDFMIYGIMGQNDLMKCVVNDNAFARAFNEGVLTFENPMLQQNAVGVAEGSGMPLGSFATPRTKRAAMDVGYDALMRAKGIFNFSTKEKGPAGEDRSAGNLFSAMGPTHAAIVAELRRLLAPRKGISVRMGMVSNLFSMDNPYMSYRKQEAPDGRIVFDATSFRLGKNQAFPMQQEVYSFFQRVLDAKKQ